MCIFMTVELGGMKAIGQWNIKQVNSSPRTGGSSDPLFTPRRRSTGFMSNFPLILVVTSLFVS